VNVRAGAGVAAGGGNLPGGSVLVSGMQQQRVRE
jgi:hypothetical protein